MPKKRSVVLCKWCKSVYVKEAAKHAKAYFSKENDTCDHHITRISLLGNILSNKEANSDISIAWSSFMYLPSFSFMEVLKY